MRNKSYVFKSRIETIFPEMDKCWSSVKSGETSYKEDVKHKTLTFKMSSNEVTYDKLTKLANLLGTTHINFTGSTPDYGDSIGIDYEAEIVCTGVKF